MDERTLELIHGEVDGTNSADEHRELLQILESEPDARREHKSLMELNDWLAAEPAFEPRPRLAHDRVTHQEHVLGGRREDGPDDHAGRQHDEGHEAPGPPHASSGAFPASVAAARARMAKIWARVW